MGEERESSWRRLKAGFVFWSLWLVSTAIAATVRFTVEGWDRFENAASENKGGMFLPWHGNTVLPIYYCRNRGFYSIVSVSRDGELQNRLLRRWARKMPACFFSTAKNIRRKAMQTR